MKKLLSIDGGGMRGIIPAVILSQLETLLGKSIASTFDLIVGNSTGGILGLTLAHPNKYPASKCIDFYTKDGPTIFSTSIWKSILTGFTLWSPKYSATGIESVLNDVMSTNLLCESTTKVMVPCFDYTEYKSMILKSWRPTDISFFDAARSTSAAPIYFPPYSFNSRLMADGGLFANNPTMCGLVEMQRLYPGEEYLIISLGCGGKTTVHNAPENYGLTGFGVPIIDILMDAQGLVTDYQMKAISKKGTYFRLNPLILGLDAALDDASMSTMTSLNAIATDFITNNTDLFSTIVKLLT